jgi:hypothetical protein
MEVTARLLGQSIRDKAIILTGAIVPYKFGSFDGLLRTRRQASSKRSNREVRARRFRRRIGLHRPAL